MSKQVVKLYKKQIDDLFLRMENNIKTNVLEKIYMDDIELQKSIDNLHITLDLYKSHFKFSLVSEILNIVKQKSIII